MRRRRSTYYAYRYQVIPHRGQTSILHEQDKTKEQLVKEIFDSIHIEHKTSVEYSGRRYILYGIKKHSEDLYIIKLARRSEHTKYIEGEVDLEKDTEISFKFVYLFVNTTFQIILVEKKTSVFQHMTTAPEIIRQLMANRLRSYDYAVIIQPLSSSKKFWAIVEESEEIYELDLTLNAPNMFIGNKNIRKALGIMKEATNYDETEFKFTSHEGLLRIARDMFGPWIDYITTVGGKYLMKYKKQGGGVETARSQDNAKKTSIKQDEDDGFSDENLEDVNDKMELIHDSDYDEEE